MKERESLKIMQRCSRFERCDVPTCPLDLYQDYRTRLPGEKQCPMAKAIRLRIGKDTPLPRFGLTKKEHAAKKRWQMLSDSEKQRRIGNLRPY